MVPQWLIEKTRDGERLADVDIAAWVTGYMRGDVAEYQMAAWAMAVLLRGLTLEETTALTLALWRSGGSVPRTPVGGPRIDKHSTGGMGDKISLILAPLAASCGLVVPMIAGRGLGLTGGTLDKLEAIPGFRVELDPAEMGRVVDAVGCAIVGQSDAIAPADRKLYALRDVTGTVPAIPLIVASILSKKLAENLDGLVLDVKWGCGAFMPTRPRARALARTLLAVSRSAGLRADVALTEMNQPHGRAVGNAVEVREAIEVLRGAGPSDVVDLTVSLTARMVRLAEPALPLRRAETRVRAVLRSGAAFDRFRRMVAAQGGEVGAIDDPRRLPQAALQTPVPAPRAGRLSTVDAGLIGRACLILGAGRRRTDERIDPAAGITDVCKVGEVVEVGAPLAVAHANERRRLEEAMPLILSAFQVEPV